MASHGQAELKDIWSMLDGCAEGWRSRETLHFYCIMWRDRTYPSFPKKRAIDVGHIKKMVKHLRIPRDCAERHLPILK